VKYANKRKQNFEKTILQFYSHENDCCFGGGRRKGERGDRENNGVCVWGGGDKKMKKWYI
jgi:hypothetical protein